MASTAGPCKRKKLGHHWFGGRRHLNFRPTIPPRRMPQRRSHHQMLSHIIAHLLKSHERVDLRPGGLWPGGRTSKRRKKLRPSSPLRHACTAAHRSMHCCPLQGVCQLTALCGMGWHLAGAHTRAPVAPLAAAMSISESSRHPFGPASQTKHW